MNLVELYKRLYYVLSTTLSFVLALRPRPLKGVLWSTRRRSASFLSVPNLKPIAQFVQKLLRRSPNLEIRSRVPGHANFYNPYAGRVGPLCLCKIWSG